MGKIKGLSLFANVGVAEAYLEDSPCQWCIENLDENGEVIEKDDD